MKLTGREVTLAVVLGVLGYVFSTKTFLLGLNELNPFWGLLVYVGISYTAIYILSRFDLVIFGWKIKTLQQTIGLFMVTFSFYLVMGWSNGYVQYVSTGSFDGASVIFLQCEDGLSFWLWSSLLGVSSSWMIWVDRVLAFSVTPFLMAFFGGFLASGKIKLH